MRSRKRFVAILSLLAVLFLAVSPSGIGVAALPVPNSPISPGEGSAPVVGSAELPAERAPIRLLPSRAPPPA